MIPEFISTKAEQVTGAYEMQDLLVDALERTDNHTHLVPRVAACHRSYRHWRCEQNHNWAEPENSCSVRICPHCARKKALRMAGRVESFAEGRGRLRYAVLAERNSERLADGIKSLWSAWTRLRRSKRWKSHVCGSVVAMEVTYNAEAMTWHPHLNVLMEGDYFPFEELRQAWVKATHGRGQTSHIGEVEEGTVRELIKYVAKLTELCGDARVLDEFLTAVRRVRVIRTYGTFFDVNVDDDCPEERGSCPDCGPGVWSAVVDLGHVPSYCLTLDARGVLRVVRGKVSVRDALSEAVSLRGTDFRGPVWRPRWADPAAGREPVKYRTVRDDNGKALLSDELPGCGSGQERQAALWAPSSECVAASDSGTRALAALG